MIRTWRFRLVVILVVCLTVLSALFTLYYAPFFGRYQFAIQYRLFVNTVIDSLLVVTTTGRYGASVRRWLPKHVVVEKKLGSQYVYSVASVVAGVNSFDRTIILQDLTGQRLRFPLEGRVLDGDVFEFTLFRMYPGLTDWRPETRTSRRGDDVLRTIFCTNYPVVLVWTDDRPLDYWTNHRGVFLRQRLDRSPVPTVSVHIYSDMNKTSRGCSV